MYLNVAIWLNGTRRVAFYSMIENWKYMSIGSINEKKTPLPNEACYKPDCFYYCWVNYWKSSSLIINPIGLSFIPSFTKLNRHYAFTLVNCNHGKVAIIHTACTTRIIYTQNYTYPISTLVYENPYTNIFKLEL